ncbi:MAG: hypothetical protein LUI87_12470, partial [Lachnospiraceae bacterium]|nr:hypothetical protein [Lachnospiraceae bacterium]
MKEFVVLGSTVKVDDELEIYIRIKKANEAGKRFMEKPILDTYNAIDDVDALIEQLPEFISELPKSMAELAVSILVGYDVYTVDEELFLEKYYEDYLDVTPIFYPLVEKYYKILDMADEMAEYQKALRESHKRWVGGGFGIKGALSGALKAQILNQANVAFHAIPDHTTKVHNEQTIVRLKRELVHNPEILEMLRNSINHVLDGVFAAVINELEEENVIEHYEFETKKAQAIYNNLMAHANELDDDRIRKLCLQIIDKDILFYPVYLFMAIRYNDESDAGLEELTRELGFYETIESDLEEIHERAVQQAMQDNADEIARVKNECEKVNNNETLFIAMEDCIRLKEVSPLLDLYDSILEALKNRMFFPVDDQEGDEIKNTIKNHGDFFTKEQRKKLYDFVNESVKEKRQNAIETRLYEKPVEIRNGFFKMADYSPVSYIYLYELGRKGNAVAQDVIYECFYGYASKKDEISKYQNEIIERIDLFLPPDSSECDKMSAFDLFWLGIRQYLTGENNRMDWIIQSASEGCAIANYFMYLVEESPKDEAYINKAVMLGSVTANIVMINRVKEKNPELVDKYARNLGYSKEELSNVSLISSKAPYATLGPTGNYGGTERIRRWLATGYINDAIEEIKRIDKACKDRFYFYHLLLKNGTVRYLIEDEKRNYYNMTGGRVPIVENDTGEFTCICFVFSKALILMTNQGVMYQTESGVD